MKIGDWFEVELGDEVFKVHSIIGDFLMVDDVHGYKRDACIKLNTVECPRCHEQAPDVEVRYSYTVYAGKMCEECAYNGYRDHCGLEGAQGSASELDEPLEAD